MKKMLILLFIVAILMVAMLAAVVEATTRVCALITPGIPLFMKLWEALELDAKILPQKACHAPSKFACALISPGPPEIICQPS